ncbi:hypothetical protein ymoll0001_26220 [Yersinia mollaretii ATCC 43969]|uniref:Uncharacterized protein n=1 Tax=Yersinia mollaretii (strain ATCC 43969 / DSM 18520 / CIP 103324 / CNY 7263 / WAIP 204) TaxID=349967 RepID=A0ABP2EJF9_YERMW|nr:hypothetical protein ymoll0001_26220 [Yersinia mollaretii ATCC 43969]
MRITVKIDMNQFGGDWGYSAKNEISMRIRISDNAFLAQS